MSSKSFTFRLGLALLAALFSLTGLTPALEAHAQSLIVGYVNTAWLNVRAGPGTTHPVVAQLGRDRDVALLGRNFDGTWLKARLPNRGEGWVSARYIVTSAAIADLPVADDSGARPKAYTTASVRLREGPGQSYPSQSALLRHGDLTLLGRNLNALWVNVRLPDEREGWVEARYLVASVAIADLPLSERVYTDPSAPPEIRFWRGEYFANGALSGSPAMVRDDPAIDFNWRGNAPAASLPADGFSARWTRTLPFETGRYRFRASVDDGLRVYVDGNLLINDWREGGARDLAGEIYLVAGLHSLQVDYYEGSGEAVARLSWEKIDVYPDWHGEYWNNPSLTGAPMVSRNDASLDFAWGQGAPDGRLPADGFSARWTRTLALEAGLYRFRLLVDDGARLWVDGRLLIDQWVGGGAREFTVEVTLAGGNHPIRAEYYEATLDARFRLTWERLTPSGFPDWKGEYFAGPNLSGSPAVTRNDAQIDFNWGVSGPANGVPADLFSVRWTRTAVFSQGVHKFYADADDGVRVTVDGQLVINRWSESSGGLLMAEVALAAGVHTVVVEYFEAYHGAHIRAGWTGP